MAITMGSQIGRISGERSAAIRIVEIGTKGVMELGVNIVDDETQPLLVRSESEKREAEESTIGLDRRGEESHRGQDATPLRGEKREISWGKFSEDVRIVELELMGARKEDECG